MRNTLLLFTLLMVFGCTNNNRDNLFNGVIDDTHLGKGCNYGSSVADATELCDVYRGNKFASNNNAEIALNKILSVTGMSKRYVLQECTDISNCVATSYKGVRYILYDPEFMDIIATHTNPWSRLAILAHEIGHHVNGHSLDLLVYASKSAEAPTLSESRQMELEADEFSGFVMYKLGASLSQAQEAIKLISTNDDDAYSTHPAKDKRLLAIAKGYNNAKAQDFNNTRAPQTKETQQKDISVVTYDKEIDESGMTAEDYFYLGRNSTQSNQEYLSKINMYINDLKEKTDITIFSTTPETERYATTQDYDEEIMWEIARDQIKYYNKAIQLDPYYSEAYFERGLLYFSFANSFRSNITYALKDLDEAIELDPSNEYAYYIRSMAYQRFAQGWYRASLSDSKHAKYYLKQRKDLLTLLDLVPDKSVFIWEELYTCNHNLGTVKDILGKEYLSYYLAAIKYKTLLIDEIKSVGLIPQANLYKNRAWTKKIAGLEYCKDLSLACELESRDDELDKDAEPRIILDTPTTCDEFYSECD